MSPADTLNFAGRAALGYPLRSALMVLAMAIGVAPVVVLTAIKNAAAQLEVPVLLEKPISLPRLLGAIEAAHR